MANGYIFSLQPTFTQGLIIGQLSILFLLAVILKFLFLDAAENTSHPQMSEAPRSQKKVSSYDHKKDDVDGPPESTEWFNLVLRQVRALSFFLYVYYADTMRRLSSRIDHD